MRNFIEILQESQIGYNTMHDGFKEAIAEIVFYVKANNYRIDPAEIKSKLSKEIGDNQSDTLYLWKHDGSPARMALVYMIRKIQENKYEVAVYFTPIELNVYTKTRI